MGVKEKRNTPLTSDERMAKKQKSKKEIDSGLTTMR